MSEIHLLVIVGTLDPADEALLEEETTPQPESKRLITTTIIEIQNIYNYLILVCRTEPGNTLRMFLGLEELNIFRQN